MSSQPGAGGDADLEAELLDLARRAATAGGAELMSRWKQPLRVQSKSTVTDPVSDADVASQEVILGIVLGERPDDAMLAEEGDRPAETASDGGLRWVVDPLDGTVNYLYGLSPFAVSVAAEDAHGEVVGVVYDPVSGDTYVATRSGPALLYAADGDDGEELSASSCDQMSQALIATGFAYDGAVRSAQGRIIAEVLPRARDIRRAGAAALDLALVAAGRLDAYYEHGVKAWDIAAGTLICRRVGLTVLKLPATPDLPAGLMVAPPALAEELFALVSGS